MSKNNSSVHFITISADEAGQRIDNFLHMYLNRVPKSMIYRIMRKGEVRVNKKRIKPEYKLKNDDEIRIPPVQYSNEKYITISTKLDKVIALNDAVLYEDEHLLILNKPAGTAVHGGSGLSFGIIEGLRALRPDANFLELVHRLDKDTSGVLLLAKKRSALCALHAQFRAKEMKKDYLALVRGQWQSHMKTIAVPLLKSIFARGKHIMRVNNAGKESETHFEINEQFRLATLVQASPITGRTHQIRVHAKYAGHPIAFDDRYGDSVFNQQLKDSGLNRLFLHAIALRFKHPSSGEVLQINAPLDTSLRQCLLYLRNDRK
ncbi:Ribosomal large subunit pseudouridine synthase C [Candidatus Gullanella endobia]|uniref:Pseudouridine synthase n=1 Tax=Candidatus Gullanella endobia TaxID=1070130 RepID=A0A143WRS2_9ENTR|nr:23S rRNA pseudouridine(955/2504/2580) synthase RluC [Candidatus Gullanella endobia]CUX96301.1 Ribosomal large subunit pseudouridine synthase C [Candidatus Gullanella endobia]